jgi:hypothetical protein
MEYIINNQSRKSSVDDTARYSSDGSSGSFSLGSCESIYLTDDNEVNDISDTNIIVSNMKIRRRTISFEGNTKYENVTTDKNKHIRRKRDVYLNQLKESPKPSSFITYMTQLMKK